jgi:quercetin dioxygenase-like cupin family protein
MEPYDVTIRSLGARLLVAPDDSTSGVAVVEHTLPPETLGAPLHRHANEDEISVVLDGELAVEAGGTVSTVAAGDAAVKNRGEWHAFWNPGPESVRFLECIAPGAFAGYFEEVAAALPDADSRAEAMARVDAIASDYGVEMDFEGTEALAERHDLQL